MNRMDNFMSKQELTEIYKNLKLGDQVNIKRDLSDGEMLPDMISTVGVQLHKNNYSDIKHLLLEYKVIDVEVDISHRSYR